VNGNPMSRSSGKLQWCRKAGAGRPGGNPGVDRSRPRSRGPPRSAANSDGLRSLVPFLRPLFVPQPIFVSDLDRAFRDP
jgi:hypothetical protein